MLRFQFGVRDGEALHEKVAVLRKLMADRFRFPVSPTEAVRAALDLGLDRLIETYRRPQEKP